MPTKNLIGSKFSRLTVIAEAEKDKRNKTLWICKCDCGNDTVVRDNNIKNGHTMSCGCLRRDVSALNRLKHGLRSAGNMPPKYRAWIEMRQRCENKNHPAYDRYGGRGIYVCARWKEFSRFFDDMGLRPSKEHSIERINNEGIYEPSNCKWATRIEQSNNKRNSLKLTLNGTTKTVAQWARSIGIPAGRIYKRIYRGCPPNIALRIANQVNRHDTSDPRSNRDS